MYSPVSPKYRQKQLVVMIFSNFVVLIMVIVERFLQFISLVNYQTSDLAK